MICCMTGKQSPQESKKLHASKGPVFKSSRAFWMEECPSPVRIKKALVHTTTPRNLNFASYRLTSPFGDVPRRFQTTLQTLKLQSLDHGNKRTFPRLPRHLPWQCLKYAVASKFLAAKPKFSSSFSPIEADLWTGPQGSLKRNSSGKKTVQHICLECSWSTRQLWWFFPVQQLWSKHSLILWISRNASTRMMERELPKRTAVRRKLVEPILAEAAKTFMARW